MSKNGALALQAAVTDRGERLEDDDVETRKGASGGSKNEGPLIDLQQIHLFQFNNKGDSPGISNKYEQ